MKFLKGKAVGWIATIFVTGVLINMGVSPPVASQIGSEAGKQAQELLD